MSISVFATDINAEEALLSRGANCSKEAQRMSNSTNLVIWREIKSLVELLAGSSCYGYSIMNIASWLLEAKYGYSILLYAIPLKRFSSQDKMSVLVPVSCKIYFPQMCNLYINFLMSVIYTLKWLSMKNTSILIFFFVWEKKWKQTC